MNRAEIYVGDVGTVFEPTVLDENNAIMDLSNATILRLKFTDPNGVTVARDAVLSNGGTDGKLRYVTAATSDLSSAGDWQVQAYIEKPGWKGHSTIHKFKVRPYLGV